MARSTVDQGKTSQGRSAAAPHRDPPLVPSRRQYLDLKRAHPNALLLYRMGDFYETFDEDARVAARDARITLTSRSFGRSGRVPMAGIPYHALNHYLGRLLAAGHTIAIAEQLSEPGRGLVERAVTRVLTPGTIAESALLPAAENRYLAALHWVGDSVGLAWVDVSTGEFATLELHDEDASARLEEVLARIGPAECLVPDTTPGELSLPGHRARLEHWHFAPDRASAALRRHFGVASLEPFGCADLPAATGAAGAILAYLERTNPALLPLLTGLRTETTSAAVGLDVATRRNLELTRSLRVGGSRGTLLGVLDHTRTAMGARALRRLIGHPLRDLDELLRRQGVVAALAGQPTTRAALAPAISSVGDLERLVSRVSQGQATARDFVSLGLGLRAAVACLEQLRAGGASDLVTLADAVDPCADVVETIERAVEEAGGEARVRAGFSAELDAAVHGAREIRRWLTGLERSERERTGIRSLKVGFNKVFGYYIEVTRANLNLVPPDYTRKQTIANGERYITTALKEAEARILAADDEIAGLERAALGRLTSQILSATARLLAAAGQIARLDALLSLAEAAARNGWVAPELDESEDLTIVGGRHPVVEAALAGESFIPNDCRLGGDAPRLLVITGPNMGGKSTYLRQVALIVLLAQIGSFVPAERARIGLVDRIFSRVGAHDDIASGHSTFMVEMVETAGILRQATARSLVILDEVGRGTSTDDGLAIAHAVVEDLHDRIGARTLFATHYLELTGLASDLSHAANAHVAALEADGRVIFLYAVRPGPADRAYGIHVARIAGLPPHVADRAEALLAALSSDRSRTGPYDVCGEEPASFGVAEEPGQLVLDGFDSGSRGAERLARELRALDLSAMSPREALDWLYERQGRA